MAAFRYIPQNAKILDLGCGTGRTTGVLINRGRQVIGGDIAFQYDSGSKTQGIDSPLLVNDACSLSFRAGEFDVLNTLILTMEKSHRIPTRDNSLNSKPRIYGIDSRPRL